MWPLPSVFKVAPTVCRPVHRIAQCPKCPRRSAKEYELLERREILFSMLSFLPACLPQPFTMWCDVNRAWNRLGLDANCSSATNCVTLDKLFNVSKTQLPQVSGGSLVKMK